MTDYEDIPYLGFPVSAAHPHRLAWTSAVCGGPQPDLTRARVLEVGCGDGANLLSIAAFEPGWTAHGIDASPRALAVAREGAAKGGLTNVTFARADIGGAPLEAGAWDVVIAHGVYSWIDPERRTALRRLIRHALSPAGLAYVSFNALPGWGVRGRIRDILVRSAAEDRAALLERLAGLNLEGAWGPLLLHEIQLVRAGRQDYVAHEYLEEHNDAFWVGDFVRDCAGDGLAWVGDSQFDLPEGRTYEVTKAFLGVKDLRGEEIADLVSYRQFRCAVLAREDAPRRAAPGDEQLLDLAFVSGIVRPTTEEFDPSSATEETMQSAGGMDILVREALSKAALGELVRIHPDAIGAAELEERARRILAETRLTAGPDEPRLLREGLLRLWRAGALELRMHRPRIAVDVPSHPKVLRFTKYESAAREVVSTALGVNLSFAAEDRALIQQMDGTRRIEAPVVISLARWGLLVVG